MILVTGASGFLGTELVKQLVENGEKIRILKRINSDISGLDKILNKIEIFEGDILDITSLEDAMQNIEYIYHSAAIISYNKSNRNKMYKTNVEGTANVVNLALQNNIKKIVHISSIAAIGGRCDTIVTEETKWENLPYNTHYGISKMQAEREIFRGIEEGLDAVIINPGIIIGKSHSLQKSTMQFFIKIKNGKFPFFTNGKNAYIDVKDVVNTSILLMKSNIKNERFIAISQNLTFKEYFTKIAIALNVKKPNILITKILGNILWRLDWFLSFINPLRKRKLTKENIEIGQLHFEYSNQKIKDALQYNFIAIDDTVKNIAKEILQ